MQDSFRLSRESAFEEHRLVRAEIASKTQFMDAPESLAVILGIIQSDKDNLDFRNVLRVVFLIIEALELSEGEGGLIGVTEHKGLIELAENLLRLIGIAPVQSKLSYLHGLLKTIDSQSMRRQGRHFLAAWEAQRAHFLSRRSPLPPSYQALASAIRSRRLGHMERAIQGFILAAELGAKDLELEKALLGKALCYRLTGHFAEAREHLQKAAKSLQSEEGHLELQWEEICMEASQTGELLPMINSVTRGDHKGGATYQLEVQLWIRAVASKKFLDRLPKIETIRRKFRDSFKRPASLAATYEAVVTFEKAYDNEIPLAMRLDEMGQLLEKVNELASLQTHLLVLAAAARWSMRFHQYYLADLALEEYKALSRKISQGESFDVLGLVADMDPKVWFHLEPVIRRKEFADQTSLQEVNSSGTYRAYKFARLGFKISTVQFKNRIRSLFAASQTKAKIREEELHDIADFIVNEVGALKGPAVKVFQLAQMLSQGLPEPLQRGFDKTLDSLPAIAPDVIQKILREEWGQDPLTKIKSFDPQPIAAASLGQVHRAVLMDERTVAIKIQYPGIEKVIRNDLNSFRLLLPFYSMLFPKADVRGNLWKSEMEFLQEIDYQREARMQELIRRKTLADDFVKKVKVPKVFPELSTSKVLVMELARGQKLWEFAATASQEDKDEVAMRIFQYLLRTFFIYGAFNADPHPGNFIINPETLEVTVLDYGFAFTYPEDRRRLWAQLAVSIEHQNLEDFTRALGNLGYVGDESNFQFNVALKNSRAIIYMGVDDPNEPISENMVSVLGQKLTVKSKNRKNVKLPLEDNALPRFFLGVMGTICKLQPRGDWGTWYVKFAEEFLKNGSIQFDEDLESA